MISRSRGYLPHLDSSEHDYFVTFRLGDSLPTALLMQWQKELQFEANQHKDDANVRQTLDREYYAKIHSYLDQGKGQCWLANAEIAGIVASALRYFDTQRYYLHAWTIMPNHVHVLFQPRSGFTVASIEHSWKSFTSNKANKLLGRSGRFWQPESFDRLIRSERQFEFCLRYILNNPVKAGLCKEVHQWRWSGVSADLQPLVSRFMHDHGDNCIP
jgi:REP element-mobilizing transposase RayT